MRLALRWLTFIVLLPATILVLLYFHQPAGTNLASLTGKLPWSNPATAPAEIPADASPTQIAIVEFWQKWAQIIYDSRPDAVSPITLSGAASIVPPSSPDSTRAQYKDLVRNSDRDIEGLRLSHERFVNELEVLKTNGDSKIFDGRGIVMVGGGEYFGPAIIGIHMLRRTGCSLPVEVFVPNKDEYEEDVCERYLPKLGAKCVVLAQPHVNAARGDRKGLQITHYQLKSPALLLSSFAEVLLLDSDSIPLVDPNTSIFETEPYKSSGLIIWPDFWAATESPHFWNIAGFPSPPKGLPPASSESGQLVINKETHLASLLLATYYNFFGPDYYYPLLSQGALGQGDKETFMAAAVALNQSHYSVRTPAQSLGRYDGLKTKGTAIVQHLPSDDMARSKIVSVRSARPAFLHSNTPKMNAGHLVDEGDLIAIDGKSRLRLLGPKADAEKLFGFDVEDTLWDLLVQTGCELASSIREWTNRDRLCERLTEHHDLVFDER